MRKILIIDGHPDPSPERLNHALARTYAKAAQDAGNEVRCITVAALDFPLLRSQDDFVKGTPPAPIQEAQRDVRWADHYVFFYPLWVGDMPALLKAFMEQTFRPGVAMEYSGSRFPKQLLRGKSARMVVTMGMPAFFYRGAMGAHSLKGIERVLMFAGVGPVRETIIGGVENAGAAKLQAWFKQMAGDVQTDTAQRRPFPRKMLRGVMRLGALAAAGYAAYALAQWAQYGSITNREEEADEMLDRVMPDYEVRVRNSTEVDAPADAAFDAICDLDFQHFPGIVNLLFKTREVILHGEHSEQHMPQGLLDQLAAFGWTVMPDSNAREVVLVTVTQPWEPNPVFRALPPNEFAGFNQPGFAKIAMALRTEPASESACEVFTETRVKTTDPVSRARFRRYWALVSPGIAIIRVALLAHVKRQAEARVKRAEVEAGTVDGTPSPASAVRES